MKKKSISLAHSTSKEKKALFTCLQSIVLLLVCSFLFSSSLFGQSIIGNYTFTNHGTGNGYTTIYSTGQSLYKYSNGTAPSTSTYVTLQMPFDFIYGSYKVSQGSSIAISPAWGYIFLNQNTKSNSYHPTSFTNALSPAGGNGSGYNSGYSNPGSYHYFHSQSGVYYKVDGVAPNRVLTIEFYKVSANGKANYSGYTNYTDVNSSYTKTFQVKLYETTSKIEFCYGPANAYGYNGQVSGYYTYEWYYYFSSDYCPYTFLKGAINTDSYFLYGTNNHSQYSYTGNWNNPTYTRNVDLGSHQYYYSYSGSGTSYYSYKYLYQYNEYWTNGLKYSFRAGVPTFTYSNTTGAGVELSWNPSSFNETTWSLEYGIKGFTPGSGTVVTTTNNANYLLTNLPPAAEVDIYVYAFANGPFGESTSTNKVTVITPCADNFYLPNIETFEFYKIDTINDCWRNFNDSSLIVIDTVREIVGYDTTWSYIYGDIQYKPLNFNYTGSEQNWVVPENVSSAKLEVWGAQGGYRSSSTYGGNGGYSKGNISLKAGDTLYVYVGGSGNTGGTSGGWNGGGSRSSYAGGGGA
ncbi:MAG TPA: glycine rich domain-containing protein, partial [Bacteroidales bacterium]|nr:glycine rich domain-containing protein [Bacteroidales bacterium]